MNAKPHLRALLLLAGVLLCACGSTKPSRFYALSAIEDAGSSSESRNGPRVRLGTIELASHLTSNKIVTRDGPSLMRFAEYDRWATGLDELFATTLCANLASLLPSEHVVRFPWEPLEGSVLRVNISVRRFEAHSGEAVLAARWGIYDALGKPTVMQLSRHTRPLENMQDHGAIVSALSACLGELSREIARAIVAETQLQATGG